MHDVDPQHYAMVIREMLRHENDVTNHRLMWLLIVQGLIANAAVSAWRLNEQVVSVLAAVGIFVTLSAFFLLYKSYQARGYLQFLGNEAKRGTLREESLPLVGWPRKRIKGWQTKVWPCLWVGNVGELLEPFFFLPSLLILAWLFVLMRSWLKLGTGMGLVVAILLVAALAMLCVLWVWWQQRDEEGDDDARKTNCEQPSHSSLAQQSAGIEGE